MIRNIYSYKTYNHVVFAGFLPGFISVHGCFCFLTRDKDLLSHYLLFTFLQRIQWITPTVFPTLPHHRWTSCLPSFQSLYHFLSRNSSFHLWLTVSATSNVLIFLVQTDPQWFSMSYIFRNNGQLLGHFGSRGRLHRRFRWQPGLNHGGRWQQRLSARGCQRFDHGRSDFLENHKVEAKWPPHITDSTFFASAPGSSLGGQLSTARKPWPSVGGPDRS